MLKPFLPMPARAAILILLFFQSPVGIAKEKDTFRPTVVLISIDGFRNDYFQQTSCPTLRALAATGVRAKWLKPIFPTKTFPNHYTIVTGLYAEHHGIVGNTMYDPVFDVVFTMRKRAEVTNGRWWGGEPIWVTAEKQGQVGASFFWAGSEALIATKRPTYWVKYDGSVPPRTRMRQLLNWLDYPESERPTIMTAYFDVVDLAGHAYGPSFAAVDTAVREVDDALRFFVDGLKERSLFDNVNIIVISDHGMAPVERARSVWLDDFINPDSVRVVDWGIIVSLWPDEKKIEDVYRRVSGVHPHMKAYRKGEIPDRWHYRENRRVAPIVLVADEGWTITHHGQGNAWRRSDKGGNHGYDNSSETMRAIFVAHGPAFRSGVVMEPIENIHLYPLMTHILGLVPAQNDGSVEVFKGVLR